MRNKRTIIIIMLILQYKETLLLLDVVVAFVLFMFMLVYYIHLYSPVGRSIHNIKRNNKPKNTQNLN